MKVLTAEVNVNDLVMVRLNDLGRKLHRDEWNRVLQGNPHFEYKPPKVDADGWSEFQLWQVMRDFGPHVGLGLDLPFDATIRFIET